MVNNFIIRRDNDKIIAVSFAVKDNLVRFAKVGKKKIHVIYDGIDLKKFIHFEKKPFKPSAPLIGTIANLRPVKGLEYFLIAAGLVLRKIPQAKFFIAGRGSLRKKLEELTKGLKISDKVVFLGFIDDVPKFL